MLNLLTKYLLQYKKVSIPSVGTIRLVQEPAQLNVADKVLLPPSCTAELINDDHIGEHQLRFLTTALREDREQVLQTLQQLGNRMNHRIDEEGFDWAGIGTIRRNAGPVALPLTTLQPVPAERVLRQDAEHKVLVGDRQRTIAQALPAAAEEAPEVVENGRSVFMLIGWILLILSVLYILLVLYQGGFKIGAAGSRQAPVSHMLMTDTNNPDA